MDATRALYTTCPECGCDLWNSFSDDDKALAVEFSDWNLNQFGVRATITALCQKCHNERTRKERALEVNQRISEHERRGDVLAGFARYGRPPGELIARNQAHWRWAQEWRPRKRFIYAYGPEGVGKSSLCRYMLYRALTLGHSVMDVPATAFSASLWLIESQKKLERLKYCGVLLIDDISNAKWSIHGLDALRTVIDYRHETGKPTLVTSNMDKMQLTEFMKTANDGTPHNAMTLLRRFAPCTELKFVGTSYRKELT